MYQCVDRKDVKINLCTILIYEKLELFWCRNFKYLLTFKLPLMVCVYIENMKAPQIRKYFKIES